MSTTTCDPQQVTPCNMGDYAVELQIKRSNEIAQIGGQALYAVEFYVKATCNLPSELFVVRKREARHSAVQFSEEYLTVASTNDLVNIPTENYDFDNRRRVRGVTLYFSRLSDADGAVTEFNERFQRLVTAMKMTDQLEDAQSIIIR